MWPLRSLPVNRLIPIDYDADARANYLDMSTHHDITPYYSCPISPLLSTKYYMQSHNITGHLHPDALKYFLFTLIIPFSSISAIAGLINKRKLLTSQLRLAFRRTSPPPWYTTNSSWAPSPTSRPPRPSQCWTTSLRYKLLFPCTDLNYI